MTPTGTRGGEGTKVAVQVDGRDLVLTNLAKPLYPAAGFAKGEVVDYYSRIAPVLLPHIAGRPVTLKRYPNGVDGHSFFEKNAPRHVPDWIQTVCLPSPGSTKNRETIDYLLIEDLPTLVWTSNLAALELHVPQWRVDDQGSPQAPDLLVIDLDPGPPATIVECCEVALLLRERLGESLLAKTSGSKGLQLYQRWSHGDAHVRARELAEELESTRPDLIVARMTKALRPGKVLLDWSQNHAAKTTVAAYSLRARATPTVSTPVSWEEVAGCRSADQLVFTAPQVLDRVDRDGDLFAPLLS